jgi:pilus assembly protein Flp/PilA
MKKVLIMLALVFSAGSMFAQDADVNKLCSEGDAAMKDKNYALALTKYSEYLKQTNYEDANRVFNCGYAAFNAKNYDEAVRFCDMAIKKGSNLDNAYAVKAQALRAQGKTAELVETAKAGFGAVKDKTNLEKLVYAECMTKGQALQKAGNTKDAETMYSNVLIVSNPELKANALFSLGGMFYNNGAKTLQAATPIATSDPDKYNAEKAKAQADFKKAQGYLEETIKLQPDNARAKEVLEAIKKAAN